MAIVFNATNETQSVKAFGNWFTFKPKQYKTMDEKLAHFLCTDRTDYGLVGLPAEFEDPAFRSTPDGQAAYEAAEKSGIDNYIKALRALIHNNQVSLRRDLEKANFKYGPELEASQGELDAMRLVAKYQKSMEDAEQKKAEEVKDLMRKIK